MRIGLAWAQEKNDESGHSVDGPHALTNWPEKEAGKVPSLISYSPAPRGHEQWGFSIDDDSIVLRWTKLELRPRSTSKELIVLRELLKGLQLVQQLQEQDDLEQPIPTHVTRNARGVVRDFFEYIGRYWRGNLKKGGKFALDEVPLDIVLTHPAVWSPFFIGMFGTSLSLLNLVRVTPVCVVGFSQ